MGVALCARPGSTDVLEFDDCAPGFVDFGHAPGAPAQCEELAPCSANVFPVGPAGLPSRYVSQDSPPGGDGSIDRPFNSLSSALHDDSGVVLLAAGDYTLDLSSAPDGLILIGICPRQVRLRTTGVVDQESLTLRGVAIDSTQTATAALTITQGLLTLDEVVVGGRVVQTGGGLDMRRSMTLASAGGESTLDDFALVHTGGSLTATGSVFLGRVLTRGISESSDLVISASLIRGANRADQENAGFGVVVREGSRAVVRDSRVMWFYEGGIAVGGGQLELEDSTIWATAGPGVVFTGDFEDSTINRVVSMRAGIDVPQNPEQPAAGVRVAGPGLVTIKNLFTDAFLQGVAADAEARVRISESWIAFGGQNGIDVSSRADSFMATDLWVVSSYDVAPNRDPPNSQAALSIRSKSPRLARIWTRPGGRNAIRCTSTEAVFEDIRVLGVHNFFVAVEAGGARFTRIANDVPGRGFDLASYDFGGGPLTFEDLTIRVERDPTAVFAGGPHQITRFLWEGCFEETSLIPGDLRLKDGEIRLLPECSLTLGVWESLDDVRLSYAE